MKKYLLPILLLVVLKYQSQINFCKPGAVWNFEFSANWPYIGSINDAVILFSTSVQGNDTLKYLTHNYFFIDGNDFLPCITIIKQKKDTIYFQNRYTSNNWQVLYNYACQNGQSWTNTFTLSPSYIRSYTTTVITSSTEVVNGKTLKKLYVTHFDPMVNGNSYSEWIYEYFGAEKYLFPFYSYYFQHSGFLMSYLCYTDATIGNLKFTWKDCNYSNTLGMNKNTTAENFKIYPNPAGNQIYFDIPNKESGILQITDVLGKILIFEENYNGSKALDLKALALGVYFYQIKTKNNFYSGKFIKE